MVLVDLLADAANWIDDPCIMEPFVAAARMRTEFLIWRLNYRHDRNGTLKDL